MLKRIVYVSAVILVVSPVLVSAQKPTAATYITDEEVKKVNSQPGVDRTIRVVDIGNENFAVGVIHRGATGARGAGAGGGGGAAAGAGGGRAAGAAAGAAGGAGRGAAAGGGAGQSAGPCGEQVTPAPPGGPP